MEGNKKTTPVKLPIIGGEMNPVLHPKMPLELWFSRDPDVAIPAVVYHQRQAEAAARDRETATNQDSEIIQIDLTLAEGDPIRVQRFNAETE